MQAAVSTDVWSRDGLVLARSGSGDGSHVVGDPCVVWDPDAEAWRMFLFFAPPGHGSTLASAADPQAGDWGPIEVLRFTNPEALPGGTHKPWVVMDAQRPNRAALVDGKYWLLTVSFTAGAREKRVQRAWAESLAGPWTLEEGDLIARGDAGEFDENHVDAVTGYWFEDAQCFVYYYMGYPSRPRPHMRSPLGSAVGLAIQEHGAPVATKIGPMLNPADVEGHWAAGWLGGFQIFPGTAHRWVAVLNASPTPPDGLSTLTSEEPAPSLGGFAYCDETFPVSGWRFAPQPIEWMSDLPEAATTAGEGTNHWRQHILVVGERARLYYNSGFYGEEQLYSKSADARPMGIEVKQE